VRELTRLLTAQGQLDHPGDRHLPGLADSIRDTLERRLARLSQPCVDVLAVVAVAGREARLDVLARVAGDAEERAGHDHAARLAGLLAEATAARVLAEPAGPLAPRRFVHDLFRETVDAGLASGERVRLHLAVGHALEALRAEGTPVHAAELAAHFLAAAPAGVAAEAVRWSALAAEEATARLAFEDARAHLERALAAMDLLDEPDPPAPLELLCDLALARDRSGDAGAARAGYLAAARLARDLGDATGLARAAIGVHGLGAPSGLPHDEPIALLEEAAGALAGQPTALRARVLAGLAGDGHPEHGSGDPALGVADLGVVGHVAGEAHAGLGHGASLRGLSGRAVCPSSWNRGPVDAVACRKSPRGKR
jgi:hypothetical protein